MYILIFSMYIQSWKNENTENVMYEYLKITMKSIWVLKYSHLVLVLFALGKVGARLACM